MRPLLGTAIAGIALTMAATAQDLRYHVGQRMRAFERAFEAVRDDTDARRRVQPILSRAVTSFFAMSLGEVARELDRARRQLAAGDGTGAEAAAEASAWADALALDPASRLVDTGIAKLSVEVRPLYRVEGGIPPDAQLRLSVLDSAGKRLGGPLSAPIVEVPFEVELDFDGLPEGDHRLRCEIVRGRALISRREQTLSVAADLSGRLESVLPLANLAAADTRTATVRGLARLIRALGRGKTLETDVPAAALLAELERLRRGGDPGKAPGEDLRLWLYCGDRSVPARVYVPAAARKSEPVPLVVALHGAGGSENLFFDGYGAGKIVDLCRKRGWLLVAPRVGMFSRGGSIDAVVDALARILPVDRNRVFGVGHSMGAARLMLEAGRDPARLQAVAILGGGGRVRQSPALKQLPVFVAAGAQDFGLSGARNLRWALRGAGVEDLRFEVYEHTEHMGIVQVALDDVFRFFDRALDQAP